MRKVILILTLVLGSFASTNAQRGRNPQPAPTPGVTSPINSERQKEISGRSDGLRLTEKFPVGSDSNSTLFRENIRPLYRSSKKSELEMLAPRKEGTQRYSAFLAERNTGLTTLVADQGCDKDLSVIVLTDNCQKFTMPGAGSTYSFRVGDYRIRTLGDMLFTGQLFQSIGTLVQGIFVELGDVPPEQFTLKNSGVEYLATIQPAADLESAVALTDKLAKGITAGNFTYRNYAVPAENTTYVLRTIAYRGKSYRTVQGKVYDELDFDKRKDLTIVFRVIRLEGSEQVTILWKVLAEKDSPKIETEKQN